MRGDLPGVTPFVFHHATTVPVGHDCRRFQRARARLEGAAIRCVRVVDVNVKKCGRRITNSGIADHDYRITDPDLGRTGLTVFPRRAEHSLQEVHKESRLVNHDPWSHGVPPFRSGWKMVGHFRVTGALIESWTRPVSFVRRGISKL